MERSDHSFVLEADFSNAVWISWPVKCDIFNSVFHIFTRIIETQLGIKLLLKSQNFLWRVLWVFSYLYLTVPNISSLKMIIHAYLFLQHYTVELKGNNIDLTEDGVAHAEIILGTDDLWDENDPWARCWHCFFYVLCTFLSYYNSLHICNFWSVSQLSYWIALVNLPSTLLLKKYICVQERKWT